MLPIDNILKPRSKYTGEDWHKIVLYQEHKSFFLVHLKRARKRQAKHEYRKIKDIQFKVGDPVYYKVHNKKGKLNLNWKPYYRILEKTLPIT